MKILDAKVDWYKQYANHPVMKVLVDRIPKMEELRYIYKDGLYYGELDGYVRFLYKMGDRQEEGFGGTHYAITLVNGERKILKGPWSSRAGVANQLGFGPCADVSMTEEKSVMERGYTFYGGGAITLPLLEEAAKIAGVYLVKHFYWESKAPIPAGLAGEQSNILGGKQGMVSYNVEIPQGVEWTAVPSLSIVKLVKEQ